MDCSPPGSSVGGISQARILFPTPRDIPDSGIEPGSLKLPALAGEFFTTRTTWEARLKFCPFLIRLLSFGHTQPPWFSVAEYALHVCQRVRKHRKLKGRQDRLCPSYYSSRTLLNPWIVMNVFKKNFYWNIINLQCCVSFRYTAKWLNYWLYVFLFKNSLLLEVITRYWV